jgi:predicted ester cyclase
MKTAWCWGVIILSLALGLGLTLGCQKKAPAGMTEDEAWVMGNTYVKARNEVNLDLLDKIYSPGVIVHDPSQPQDVMGLDALKKEYGATHAAFPDVKFTLDDLYIKDGKALWIFTMAGTFSKPFPSPMGELPPTGKTLRLSGVALDRVEGGKIVEEWLYFNALDIFQTLGFTLTPPSPPPSE